MSQATYQGWGKGNAGSYQPRMTAYQLQQLPISSELGRFEQSQLQHMVIAADPGYLLSICLLGLAVVSYPTFYFLNRLQVAVGVSSDSYKRSRRIAREDTCSNTQLLCE